MEVRGSSTGELVSDREVAECCHTAGRGGTAKEKRFKGDSVEDRV